MHPNSSNSVQAEIESSVIGALLQFSDSEVVDVLQKEHFEIDKYKYIFEAIKQLKETNKPVDMVTVIGQLKKNDKLKECGGAYEISGITAKIASNAHLPTHAAMLIESWMRRKLHTIGLKIAEVTDDPTKDIISLVTKASTAIEKLNTSGFTAIRSLSDTSESSVKLAVEAELDAIEADLKKGITPGMSYGFPDLDKAITKMQAGDLIIIAARPGMGKTILALTIAIYVAVILDKPVDFYSLEMTTKRLMHRVLSMTVGISSDKIAERRLEPHEVKKLNEARNKFNHNMHVYDSSDNYKGLNVEFVEMNIKRRQPALVVIDYLQLMSGSGDKNTNREQEISQISRKLKNCATKYGIPVIALCQLNRTVETRTGTEFRPKISDLRESGAIEQDADTVLLIYRAAYYNLKSNLPSNVTELIIGKCRHSKNANKSIGLWFDEQELCFKPYDDTEKTDLFSQQDSSTDDEQPF